MGKAVSAARRAEHERTVQENLALAGDAQETENVVPLNAGFFILERIRANAASAAKPRAAVRRELGDAS